MNDDKYDNPKKKYDSLVEENKYLREKIRKLESQQNYTCPSEKLDPNKIIVKFETRSDHKSKIQWNSKIWYDIFQKISFFEKWSMSKADFFIKSNISKPIELDVL